MRRVAVITTWAWNVGDDAIRAGCLRALASAGVRASPLYIHKHDPRSIARPALDELEVVADKIAAADLVLWAGAPLLWKIGESKPGREPWQCWLWRERLAQSTAPLLVLGAGGCFKIEDNAGSEFAADPECAAWARELHGRAALLAVRDSAAATACAALGLENHLLVCPSILAGGPPALGAAMGPIAVNLMPRAGHYSVDFDEDRWRRVATEICLGLRALGPLLFVAHDAVEARFCRGLTRPGERIFAASGIGAWREYADVYARCRLAVCCRVHGALLAAASAVPAMVLGTDTRLLAAAQAGLATFDAGRCSAGVIAAAAADLLARRGAEVDRLVGLIAGQGEAYARILGPFAGE